MDDGGRESAKAACVLCGAAGLILVTVGSWLPWRAQALPSLPGVAYAAPGPVALTAYEVPAWGTSLGLWLVGLASVCALAPILGARGHAARYIGIGSAAAALGLVVGEQSVSLGPILAAGGLALQLYGHIGTRTERGGEA